MASELADPVANLKTRHDKTRVSCFAVVNPNLASRLKINLDSARPNRRDFFLVGGVLRIGRFMVCVARHNILHGDRSV